MNSEMKKESKAKSDSTIEGSAGTRQSFASQIQQLKLSFEQSLDQQLSSLAEEVEVRASLEAKVAELTASETKLREELESALDRAAEQRLQVKRITKAKGLDRANAQERYAKIEKESRSEIESLKNQLAIAIEEKNEFSEFFQYTEKVLKEKVAALEAEKLSARREAEEAKNAVFKIEADLQKERSIAVVKTSEAERVIRKLENSLGSDQGRIDSYEQQLEKVRSALATQENESRRKLAFIADEKWGLELQVAQLTKDIEVLKVRLVTLDEAQARIKTLEQELKASAERKPDFTAFNEVRAQFNDEFNRVKAERSNLEARYTAAQEEMGGLRSQILKAQAELEKTQMTSEKTISALRAEFDAKTLAAVESERLSAQKRLQDRETEFTTELKEMRRELADATARASTMGGQLEAARERLTHFAEIEQESCAEIVRLTDLIEKERAENRAMSAERIQVEYTLRKEIDLAQARATQAEGRLQTSLETLTQIDAQLTQLRETSRVLTEEKAKFEAHTLRLTQELARAETSAWDFEESLEKATIEREKLRLSEAKTKIELSQVQSDLGRVNGDLTRLRTAHEATVSAYEAAKSEREKAKESAAILSEAKAQLESQLKFEKAQAATEQQRSTSDFNRVEAALTRAEESLEKLKIERDQLKERNSVLTEAKSSLENQSALSGTQAQARIQRLTEDLAKAEVAMSQSEDQIEKILKDREAAFAKIAAAAQTESQLKIDVAEAQAKIQRLTGDLEKAESANAESEDQIEKILKEREVANLKAAAHLEQKMQLEIQKSQFEAQISRMNKEFADEVAKSKSIRKENEELRAEQAEYADANSRLRLQENQLRHFASSLGKEKTEIAKLGETLLGELRLLSKTHPLKDYLSATEFEISKVSLQLKTTPTLAPERLRSISRSSRSSETSCARSWAALRSTLSVKWPTWKH